MAKVNDIAKLKEQIETLKQKRDKAKGAEELLMTTLKKEHGCKTLEEAKELLASLESQEGKLSKRLERVLAKFEEKWGNSLGDA